MLSVWSMSDQGRSWRSLFTFTINIYWKDWCWSWNSNTLATWCYELTHLKRPWCWERLKARGDKNNKGWDGWMASTTQWTWVWVNSGKWWWTGRPDMLQSMGSQIVGHDGATVLNRMVSNVEFCSCDCWPFILIFGEISYSSPLLIF